ncbi:transposable element Tc1 transposase [Trichonephila clavipes]|nr:transposable element Tc1 transposase [Trichonephila clavipes]
MVDTSPGRPGSGRPRGTTARKDNCIRRTAVAHRTASVAEIRVAVGTTVTQQTVRNWLLQALTLAPWNLYSYDSSHCYLRRQWCQARAHWRTEWRSVAFSDVRRFCFGASNGHLFVRRGPGEHLQLKCLRLRHTRPTPGIMVWGEISYDRRGILMVIPNTLTVTIGIAFQASITAGVLAVRMVDLAGYVICALIRPKGVLWDLDRGSEKASPVFEHPFR